MPEAGPRFFRQPSARRFVFLAFTWIVEDDPLEVIEGGLVGIGAEELAEPISPRRFFKSRTASGRRVE